MPENYTVNWTELHAPLWRRVLGKFVGVPDINALEIGTFEGRSAVWFAREILTGTRSQLTCVDPWVSERLAAAQAAEALFDANVSPFGDRIRKVKSQSVPFLLHCAGSGARYDWAYVDGDHRANACLTDMVLVWQLLHPNGVMIIDDTGNEYSALCRGWGYPSPRDAANAFLHCFAGKYRLLHNVEQVVIEKLPMSQ